jgi:hypothetical protein
MGATLLLLLCAARFLEGCTTQSVFPLEVPATVLRILAGGLCSSSTNHLANGGDRIPIA